MNKKGSRIRVFLVRKLKVLSKKSWKQIARECYVHQGTVKRWLAGEEALRDNIIALAKSLNTTPEKITLPEGEEDLPESVEAEMVVEGNPAKLKQPQDIIAIIEDAQKRIGAKYKILLMYVGEGSIRIGIKLHPSDAMRLVNAFIQGELRDLKIVSVSILTPVNREMTDPLYLLMARRHPTNRLLLASNNSMLQSEQRPANDTPPANDSPQRMNSQWTRFFITTASVVILISMLLLLLWLWFILYFQ